MPDRLLPRAPRWTTTAALVLLVLIGAGNALRFCGYVCDDAVISFRSVQNWHAGLGLVYNPGERVETFTNLGWVWLLALARGLGIGEFAAATWLGWAAAVGCLLAQWALAKELLPGRAALLPLSLVACSTTLMGQAGSGLETTTAALLLTWGLARLLRECREADEPVRWPGLGMLLLALATLVRIDGVLVLSGALVLEAVWLRPGLRRRHLAIDAAVAMVGVLLPALFRLVYYGSVIPNPVQAKVGLAPDPSVYRQGVSYLLDWLHTDLGVPVLGGGLLLALLCGRRAQALTVLAAGWLGYIVLSGGDHMPYARFVAPMLPAISVLVFAGGRELFVRSGLLSTWPGRSAAVVGVAALTLWPLQQSLSRGNIPVRNAAVEDYRRAIGEHFARLAVTAPGELVVAGGAAGFIGYFGGARLRFIDMLGLTDRHIATVGRRDPLMPPGHQRGDGDYVLAQRPDYVIFGAATPGDRWQQDDAAAMYQAIRCDVEGWEQRNAHHFSVSVRDLLHSDTFARDYQLQRVVLPSGQPFTVFARR